MSLRMTTRVAISLAAVAALGLAGCGVRGSLESPAKAQGGTTTPVASGATGGSGATPAPKPHRPFVLDGILR